MKEVPLSQLTMRDLFAIVALHAWMKTYTEDIPHPCADDCGQSCAALAYELADFMLEAREKQPEEPQP